MLSLWSSPQAGKCPALLPGLRDVFPHPPSMASKRRPWLMTPESTTTPDTGSVFCTFHAFSESKTLLQSGQYVPTCLPRGPPAVVWDPLQCKAQEASVPITASQGPSHSQPSTPQAPDTLPAPSHLLPGFPPISSQCARGHSAVRKCVLMQFPPDANFG